MTTLRALATQAHIPMETAWHLTDLAEAKGRLHQLTRQAPGRLRALHEAALAEGALSSNGLEGVGFDASGGRELVFGWPAPRGRREVRIRRYRDALEVIHDASRRPAVSEATVLELHRILRDDTDDAGHYREEDLEILERGSDGRARRLETADARDIPETMRELIELWNRFGHRTIPQPLALAAFNLDFLNIHPFRDATGRISRLLFVLQCYHLGIDVVHYVSFERLLEENKDRYYETLETSSGGWHTHGSKHRERIRASFGVARLELQPQLLQHGAHPNEDRAKRVVERQRVGRQHRVEETLQ
jgi:Fic family protein